MFADVRGSTSLAETMSPREFARTMDDSFHLVARAVDAGRALASELRKTQGDGSVFPAGVGVHTGVGYVGVIGEPGSYDFTVQGDVANTTARLGSSAANGELILSDAIVAESGLSTAAFSRRLLDLKGKAQPTEAWVELAAGEVSPES